jgi:HPt (histidine-containing phosphotransfer) domain-containing protein
MLARWLAPREHAAVPTLHPPSHSSSDTLNVAVLEQLREMFDGDVKGILRAYLADAPRQLAAMTTALERRDYSALGRAAHSLKSSSESVGALAMSRLAAELEALSRDSSERATYTVAQLRDCWPRTQSLLTAQMAFDTRT